MTSRPVPGLIRSLAAYLGLVAVCLYGVSADPLQALATIHVSAFEQPE